MTSSPPTPPPQQETFRRVGEILGWTERYFGNLGIESPRLDAEILLANALGVERIELYTGYEKPVDQAERGRFRELVKRRARREPVAYLVGRKEFYSVKLEVQPGVFIPRPETEHAVEESLAWLARVQGSRKRVLDLGTGSGNIAIAIAGRSPDTFVDAVDVSPTALKVAARNVKLNGLDERVRLLEGDLFEPVGDRGPYDVIVSNPPYVRSDELDTLEPEVRLHEPREALVDTKSRDGDGLGYYRSIARRAPRYLPGDGALVVEVGEGQAPAVEGIFREHGFASVTCLPDHGRVLRIVVGSCS